MSTDPFLAVQQDVDEARRPRPKHPSGWEPGIDTAAGTITVEGGETPPKDWSHILWNLGLDPADWQVDEDAPVQVRSWDSGERRQFYYRATVIPASSASSPDVDALIKQIKRRRPIPPKDILEERALVVLLSDWQAGKADAGGHEALIARLLEVRKAVPERVRQLARQGRPVSDIYVIGLGDMVEGCGDHYAQQTYSVELDRRQQLKLVRRMLVAMLAEWSRLPAKVVVGCVPGNHGENRRAGKSYTTFEDNADLEVFEQAAEILAANPDAYGHVRFTIPDGDLTLTLDVVGTVVGFAHGHQFNGSGIPLAKARSWWQSKMGARHPIGDAEVLCYGHFHHLQLLQDGPRTIMGAPSNDGGSRWYEEQGGNKTACGTLTFVCEGGGWGDLAIL